MYVRILVNDLLYNLGAVVARLCFIAAISLVAYQGLLWLEGREGLIGTDLLFTLSLKSNHPFVLWLNEPDSWLGLHRFLTLTPLSAFLLLIGWGLDRLLR